MDTLDSVLDRYKEDYFVNRRTEISLFENMLIQPGEQRSILSLSGVGGVGKSALLRVFASICEDHGIPEITINCREFKSPIEIMQVIDEQFADSSKRSSPLFEFHRTLSRFENIVNRLNALRAKNVSKGTAFAVQTSLAVVKSVAPFTAPFIESLKADEKVLESIRDYVYGKLSKDDQDLLFNPEQILTDRLLQGLYEVSMDQEGLVIIFDTFEVVADSELWIREKLVPNLSSSAIVIISGRKKLGNDWERWRPLIREIELVSFSDEDTRLYLSKRGIEESALTDQLFNFTSGHPMCLAISADLYEQRYSRGWDDWDEGARYVVIETLVERVFSRIDDEEIRALLATCSIVRYLNKDIMEFLVDEAPEEIEANYSLIKQFSFVYPRSYGIVFHDTVREYLRESLKQHSYRRYIELNERALKYYTSLLQGADVRHNEILREILFHEMSINENRGMQVFKELFDDAAKLFQVDFCEQLLNEVIAFELEQHENRSWIEYYRGMLAFRQGRWADQERICQVLVQDFSTSRRLRAKASIDLGAAYVRQGKLPLAHRLLNEAVEIIRQVGTEREIGDAVFELAKVYRWQGDWERTFQCFSECRRIFENTNQQSRIAEIEMHTALIYQLQGRWEEAMELCRRSLDGFKNSGNEYGVGRSLFNLGWICMLKGQLQDAERLCAQSIDFSRRLRQKHSIGMSLIVLGDIYRSKGQFDEAEKCLKESQELLSRMRYEVYQGALLRSWGELLHDQGKTLEAIKRLEQSRDLLAQLGLSVDLAKTLRLLGKAYRSAGQVESAISCYTESLKLAIRHNLHYIEAVVRAEVSEALVAIKQNTEEAKRHLQRSKELSSEMGYTDMLAEIKSMCGDLFD